MKIIGIGSYLPTQRRSSEHLDAAYDLPSGTVFGMTGVRSRSFCGADENQVTMGVAAAQAALADANCGAGDIDLVIGASAVPYQPIPATAPAYQAGLGIADGAAFAFDVNATCLSFLTALEVCAGLLARGSCRRALVIASEVASRALPWETHPEIAGLFGDGAAAVVIEQGEATFCSRFRTYPSGYDICEIGAGGTRFDFRTQTEAFAAHSLFHMDGKALFRLTSKTFVPFLDHLLHAAGWERSQVDLVIPHQASPMALRHLIRQCGFGSDIVVDISAEVGNQIAASIPYALAHARDRLKPGSRVLMLGTSAGVSLGGVAVTV
ncbi:MAG: ketoacyl-ACP synthase III [Yoonia sp.]|uniref:3-oxoacyl-[acyl-carrier-protein] synthase III C-terminal domain-containing protein n=1 Tax=Yoonia sp. TaxID=2212373 RepID=UPI00273E313C|nr:3-oxoacyl-[acyl-carrier-protein] synthase III C-terminal domain-containing protein [Yoonia sp.]MDP5084565.1 ketoacyl-ACP synthase III [Yoonia sp.]